MRNACLLATFLLSFCYAQDWQTPYERSAGTESATYQEAIQWYERLAADYEEISIQPYGRSDAGEPIHLVRISKALRSGDETTQRVSILINNGIHPGEPCGIDACMMLARDLMQKPELSPLLDHVVIGIIPVYNIGGALNRSCCTRANQIGPLSQGFRGNATNRDLNRDFMKMDAHNTRAFAEIFQDLLPELFLDTHTTNGADYQAPITYIATLADKLEPSLATYLESAFLPALLSGMDKKKVLISPYVNKFDGPPEEGMAAFPDLPRYASGYTALFQTLGFISEAHMLKTFEERVDATYAFILVMLEEANRDHLALKQEVNKARTLAGNRTEQALNWALDTTRHDSVMFHGFRAEYRPGAVTGAPRLFYDQTKPFSEFIPYFPHYLPTTTLHVPKAYLIPQAWTQIIDRLQWSGVETQVLSKDTLLEVEVYVVEIDDPAKTPYEGHYYHQTVSTHQEMQQILYRKGDVVVMTQQWRLPFIAHALEPEAVDSWFRWNFFDGIMMQKEYFSPYLFENLAAKILEEDPELKKSFEAKKKEEPDFAQNSYAQLSYIYQHSPYYEKTHKRYPVGRWQGGKLPAN
ncbi:MAG: M14 family zinc carboxypeptidase [Bacteroidia bacterium]|nr:M14 family zinc carboxypeptidase [Bacteroidia bacterium]